MREGERKNEDGNLPRPNSETAGKVGKQKMDRSSQGCQIGQYINELEIKNRNTLKKGKKSKVRYIRKAASRGKPSIFTYDTWQAAVTFLINSFISPDQINGWLNQARAKFDTQSTAKWWKRDKTMIRPALHSITDNHTSNLPMMLRLTLWWRVGEFRKSTRHRYNPSSEISNLSTTNSAGVVAVRNHARESKCPGEDHLSASAYGRPRTSKLKHTKQCTR